MSDVVDVLVVGGGPAGLAAAEAAAGSGSVLVLHRDKQIGRPVRTSGASWKRDVDRLGIPSALYHEIGSGTFAGPTQRADFVFGHDRPVILDVTGTYEHLAGRATATGAEICTNALFG